MTKTLLIVFHSMTGGTRQMAQAAARAAEGEGVRIRLLEARDAAADDVLAADAYLFATPENLAAMAGMMKDFFDRTYYPCEGKLTGLPYAEFVSAGNDGTGAVREIGRIANGYGWKVVAEALIVRKEITPADLVRAEELGEALAAGLAMGVF